MKLNIFGIIFKFRYRRCEMLIQQIYLITQASSALSKLLINTTIPPTLSRQSISRKSIQLLSGVIRLAILQRRRNNYYTVYNYCSASRSPFKRRADSLIQLAHQKRKPGFGASRRVAAATLEIYEAIYKLAVIVLRFGTKLSPKSKRLPAFIKRQANPGNWPLATLPRRATTSVVKHCLLSFAWTLCRDASTSVSVIRAPCNPGAPNLSGLSSISVNWINRLVFPKQRATVRSKHAVSKTVQSHEIITSTRADKISYLLKSQPF